MKSTLEGINSRLGDTEHVRIVEITQSEQQREKQILKNENSLREFWGNIKHTNICIRRVSEEQGKEKKDRKYI